MSLSACNNEYSAAGPQCDDLLQGSPMAREHFELRVRADAFAAAVEAGVSLRGIENQLTQLIAAFESHFSSEEGLMRSTGFPGLLPHTDEHRRLIAQIRELHEGLSAGAIHVCEGVTHFTRLWMEQHCAGPDAALAQFLHNGKMPRPDGPAASRELPGLLRMSEAVMAAEAAGGVEMASEVADQR
jgi:hemerythrin-like metal-binding protein